MINPVIIKTGLYAIGTISTVAVAYTISFAKPKVKGAKVERPKVYKTANCANRCKYYQNKFKENKDKNGPASL